MPLFNIALYPFPVPERSTNPRQSQIGSGQVTLALHWRNYPRHRLYLVAHEIATEPVVIQVS